VLCRSYRSDRPTGGGRFLNASPALGPVLRLAGVSVVRGDKAILDEVRWEVGPGERWAVLGANGSGKTTLLAVGAGRLWPTKGMVELLGHRLGRIDLRELRPRISLVSGSLVRQLRPAITARQVVVTGRSGDLEPWWHEYGPEEWERADALLASAGVHEVGDRMFGVISEGERQQVLLARALMSQPELLLLDEPAAGLDLGARERLLGRLGALVEDPASPPIVLVTHHLEEVPVGTTHAALVRDGRLEHQGPIDDVLTSPSVSDCFSVAVEVGRSEGRWWSRATR
jgi:iron complex transport system ATP-binding protein